MTGTDLNVAEEYLLQGKLVAIPTETVYGLSGNALDPLVVASIFHAKNRPTFDPLIVHTFAIEEVYKYVNEFPEWAQQLAELYWPGPLTLLLPKRNLIPDIVTNGSELVGFRIPNHPLTLSLLKALPFPLAAPSANPFGYISPTTAAHVADQLEDKIAYILDGGPSQIGLESTIIGLKENKPVIYRLGGISLERIENDLSQKVSVINSTSNPTAPGMLDSHYAPGIPLFLGNPEEIIKQTGHKVGIISFHKNYSHLSDKNIILSPENKINQAAGNLFSALREMDKSNLDAIIAEIFPEEGLGRAINDRLKRASFKR